jgi:hypothetical protein
VQTTELPFWQPLPHGSAAWYDSFNQRNRIEGIFGSVKNDASQNLTRGRFRVMGLARVSLMTLFIVMAANLRLAQTFRARQEQEAAVAARQAPATSGSAASRACTPGCARRWVRASPSSGSSPPRAMPARPGHRAGSRRAPGAAPLPPSPHHHRPLTAPAHPGMPALGLPGPSAFPETA